MFFFCVFFFFKQKPAYDLRISDWSSDVCSSDLIVLRYQPGERYLPHRDYFSPSALAAHRPDAGQRMTTVCVYLNPVTAGGGTEFPELGIRVDPTPGAAVVFDNLDATGAPAASSCHAGLAVERSEEHTSELQSLMSNSYAVFGLKK